eukprot:CAMPEP_0183297620 /NCGR_PEP_ID=MMETSP0160_2-20130417/4863_1 /TAXON_ID=2839 ORGANISM="Odontella Sinensis, Strain Grunow 1884" /NCGR_SAMPLE_ID=MMETSP0160_2 /ASSEMBLY_ACC=CAM_ASM_000250 /LENGTH=159 /DNA_ID=CAMNT_0025459477 /DNA_START=208 /DNA_END=684 /DNA_ORIENTATION=-
MKTVDINTSIDTTGHYIYDAPASFSSGNSQSQEQNHLDRQHHPSTKVNVCGRDDHGTSVIHGGKKDRCYDTFPMKLHKVFRLIEEDGLSSVMSWTPSGKAFRVNKRRFSDETAQKYFSMQRMQSFFRQLNIYSFKRTTLDTGDELYFHDLFIQNHPQLA